MLGGVELVACMSADYLIHASTKDMAIIIFVKMHMGVLPFVTLWGC